MNVPSRLRTPNPHLGAYYGIVTSAFVSLIVMLAMFEQLGWGRPLLAQTMMLVPLALYLLIAIGSRTLQTDDFFASGRRVPPVYNGFVLAAIAVGGVGFLAYTGTVFFLGFDALAIGLGWTFGMFVAGVLFVPYLRKAGSYTLPSFLGHRFRSRSLRLAASVMQVPPTALLLVAEIKIAALIASLFLPVSLSLAVLMVAALIAAFAILGGMRSLTWTGSAQFLVGAVGLAIVVTTVSILLTNVPAPQLTYGEIFSALQNAEITAGVTPVQPGQLATSLPGTAPLPTVKPFLQPFGILGPLDFVTLFLCLALGTAALPSLLTRSGVTSSIADQRRASAWGLLFVALFVMTAPAMAAFAKLIMFRDIALAASASHLFTLGASLAEDLYRVLDRRQAFPRLIVARAAIAASAVAAAVFLLIADLDPLKTALLAFAFAASTFFPALLLAIWWRRCTKWGVMAAMTTGFTVMSAEAVLGGAFGIGPAGFTTSLASLIGIALALVAGVAVSLYLRLPSRAEDTYREEMRDPGGETIYDRAQMRAAAAAAASAAAGASGQ
jgi:cation/acetate symporter